MGQVRPHPPRCVSLFPNRAALSVFTTLSNPAPTPRFMPDTSLLLNQEQTFSVPLRSANDKCPFIFLRCSAKVRLLTKLSLGRKGRGSLCPLGPWSSSPGSGLTRARARAPPALCASCPNRPGAFGSCTNPGRPLGGRPHTLFPFVRGRTTEGGPGGFRPSLRTGCGQSEPRAPNAVHLPDVPPRHVPGKDSNRTIAPVATGPPAVPRIQWRSIHACSTAA